MFLSSCSRPRSAPALNPRTNVLEFHGRHATGEWRHWLDTVDTVVPAPCDVHLNLPNYALKTPWIHRWLARGRVHFTPTGASWTHLVERRFADLTRE